MTNRNIATCIILSIVTCGIYGIVWFIKMTDEAAYVSEDHSMSGGMAFLLTLVTCGLYTYYWNYKMGKMLYETKLKKDMPASDNAILYLVLSIFGLSIVNYCLIQSDLNALAENA